MRKAAALDDAERRILAGVAAAIGGFLELARRGVLGEESPAALTADGAGAGEEPPPPDLNGWPADQQWMELVQAHVVTPVSGVFGEQFAAEVRKGVIADGPWRDAYLETVYDRLKIWPAGAFEEIRLELLESMAEGEDHRAARQRVGQALDINAKSRQIQADINALTSTIDDPDTAPQIAREARARRAALYRSKDVEDLRWEWKAARIARTETLGAFNGGTYSGAVAWSEDAGEELYKQWWATSDNRVRSSHWAAHMSVVPLAAKFSVGGYELDHPGDPDGPGQEVINCRCTLITLSAAEAPEQIAQYEAWRPSRTDQMGRPIDDAGNPIPDAVVAAGALEEDTVTAPVLQINVVGADGVAVPVDPSNLGWRGVLAPLDQLSGDGRMIAAPADGVIPTRPLPAVLLWQDELDFGHDGAFVFGSVDQVWIENGLLMGEGRFDLADPRVPDLVRKVAEGWQRWVSVDLDMVESEYRCYLDGVQVDCDALYNDCGCDDDFADGEGGEGKVIQFVDVAGTWRLMGATCVSQPAFAEAVINVVDLSAPYEGVRPANTTTEEPPPAGVSPTDQTAPAPAAPAPVAPAAEPVPAAIVAGAGPLRPAASWFVDPKLTAATPLTVTEDGRVFGHAALFDACHIGYKGKCVTAPKGCDYGMFHVGALRVAEGYDIAVGNLVLGTDHAATDHRTTVQAAMAHYADSGYGVATVRTGEDEFGVWVAGSIAPDASEENVAALRRCTLSGDWRELGGKVHFIAALAVNVGGLPVPRRTTGEDGRLLALVAAAAPPPARLEPAGQRKATATAPGRPSGRVVVLDAATWASTVAKELRAAALREKDAARLAGRVHGNRVAAMAARVHGRV